MKNASYSIQKSAKKQKKECLLQYSQNAGGGDCLFWTIYEFLQSQSQSESFPNTVLELRKKIDKYMLLDFNKWFNGIEFNLKNYLPNLNKTEYSKYMIKSGVYGTITELYAAAELFKFNGTIIQYDHSNMSSIHNFGYNESNVVTSKSEEHLFILFTGPSANGHFRKLELKKPKSLSIPFNVGKLKILGRSNINLDCKISLSFVEQTNTDVSNTQASNSASSNAKETLESSNDIQNEIICEICQKSCRSNKHLVSEKVKCEECGEIFDNNKSLKAHTRIRHKQSYRSDIVKNFVKSDLPIEATSEDNDIQKESTLRELHQIKIDVLQSSFSSILQQFDENDFQQKYNHFEKLAQEAIIALPGPRHPAQKYFEARKRKETFVNVKRSFQTSSNPQRSDKRSKEKTKEKYNYELCQYLYTNKRKSLVNKFLNQCKCEKKLSGPEHPSRKFYRLR